MLPNSTKVYIASTGFVERFDTLNSRWLTPTFIGDNVNHLTNDGTDIYIAGESSGAHKMSTNGTIIQTWDTSQGLASNSVQRLAVSGNKLVPLTLTCRINRTQQQIQFRYMMLLIN